MLKLTNIYKTYHIGNQTINALRGVNLTIEDGDFVAIMGPSGSGKSTLMHVIGLLDVPDDGSYVIDGKETSNLSEDDLAIHRRESIGFIFQQFNLLPRMTALENVSLPLIYSEQKMNFERSKELLELVGLGSRVEHRPNEMSGGQQQRVAIARSLINKPSMVLADEPTGNLDSVSEKEVIGTLRKLNENGITVVIVTHEEEIGKQAKRLIRMRDGEVQSDERIEPFTKTSSLSNENEKPPDVFRIANLFQHIQQGVKTLANNKVRSALSMLGILIGVAAVVAMLALGKGAQKAIEQQLSSLGSNLLVLRPGAFRGTGGAMLDSGSVTRLTLEDAAAIKQQVDDVLETAPNVQGRGQVTYGDKNWSTQVLGASASYAKTHAEMPDVGRFFSDDENKKRTRVAAIGATVVRNIFGSKNPIGENIKINKVSFQVIGILPEKGATGFRDQDDIVVVPVQTAMHRLLGKEYVDFIDVELTDPIHTADVQDHILDLMVDHHRVPYSQRDDAFQIRNMADIQEALSSSTKTMTVLLSVIAAISLLVGGIGIMNIMLVSVTERTREIGLRKAIGARRADILQQFLIEAVVISLIGGFFGVLLAWLTTVILANVAGWAVSISMISVVLAFGFSGGVGIVFGIYPARKASMLSPIDALRYE